MTITISELGAPDRPWVRGALAEAFGAPVVVSCGVLYQADTLPGWVARIDDAPAGLLTFDVRRDSMEIVALVATIRGRGVAEQLFKVARARAVEIGCRRLWLVTTNDNRPAHQFYEKLGMRRVEVRAGAVAEARSLKPEIPERGHDDVPIEDEWIYELGFDREGDVAGGDPE